MNNMFATKAELDTWMKDKNWFFVKRIFRGDSIDEDKLFTDTYLTPNGQEVNIYFEHGLIKHVNTVILKVEN